MVCGVKEIGVWVSSTTVYMYLYVCVYIIVCMGEQYYMYMYLYVCVYITVCMGEQYYMYMYVCVYIIVSIASIFLGSLV